MSEIRTPADVMARLDELSDAIEECADAQGAAEFDYQQAKTERGLAEYHAYKSLEGQKLTVDQRRMEIEHLIAGQIQAEDRALATIKALRHNKDRLHAQADIVRSQGALMRSSMELV
jgi:hypothetical protein